MNWLQYTPAVQALFTTEAQFHVPQITQQAFLLQLSHASHHVTNICAHLSPTHKSNNHGQPVYHYKQPVSLFTVKFLHTEPHLFNINYKSATRFTFLDFVAGLSRLLVALLQEVQQLLAALIYQHKHGLHLAGCENRTQCGSHVSPALAYNAHNSGSEKFPD